MLVYTQVTTWNLFASSSLAKALWVSYPLHWMPTNVWITLANATHSDTMCTSMATPGDPFHMWFIGAPIGEECFGKLYNVKLPGPKYIVAQVVVPGPLVKEPRMGWDMVQRSEKNAWLSSFALTATRTGYARDFAGLAMLLHWGYIWCSYKQC